MANDIISLERASRVMRSVSSLITKVSTDVTLVMSSPVRRAQLCHTSSVTMLVQPADPRADMF